MQQASAKEPSFYRRMLTLVLPMAAQNLLNALLSASDALMLGLLDQNSLSAVSLAAQVQFVFSLVMDAAIVGTTILAAQYWARVMPARLKESRRIRFVSPALSAPASASRRLQPRSC